LEGSLGQLEWKAFNELNDVSDYIWKSPRFLEYEKTAEQRKMQIYFPEGGRIAEIRRHYESTKLNETFPRLIAVANLFVALSVFENYVLLLLKTLQEHDTGAPKQELRQGIKRHIEATKSYGADPYRAQYYEQISVAISIRNCLMHAKGLLTGSREAEVLKTQIEQLKFLCSDNRKRRADQGRSIESDVVRIEISALGEELVITNNYAHLVCFYLNEYFRALCGTLNSNAALRSIVQMCDPRDLKPESPNKDTVM